jgi:hypothetical protein
MPRNDHHSPYNEGNDRHHNFQARTRNRPGQQELEPWHRTLHQVPYESSVANYVELDPFTQPQSFPFPVPQVSSHRAHGQPLHHHRPNYDHDFHLNAPARVPAGRGPARHNENLETQRIKGPHSHHPGRHFAGRGSHRSVPPSSHPIPVFADHSMESPRNTFPEHAAHHPIEPSHESNLQSQFLPFGGIPRRLHHAQRNGSSNQIHAHPSAANHPNSRHTSLPTHNHHHYTDESEAPTGYEYRSSRNINEKGDTQRFNHSPQSPTEHLPHRVSQPNEHEHNQAAELEDYLASHSIDTLFGSLPPYVARPGERDAAPEHLPSTRSDGWDYPGIRQGDFHTGVEEGGEENNHYAYYEPPTSIHRLPEYVSVSTEGDVIEQQQFGLRSTSIDFSFDAFGVVYYEEEIEEGGTPPIPNYSAQEANNSAPPYIRQNTSHDKQNHRKSHEINKTNLATYPNADPLSIYQPHFLPWLKNSSPTSDQSSQFLPQPQSHSHKDQEVHVPTQLRQALENLQHALDNLVAVYIQTLGEGEGRAGQGIEFHRRMNPYDGDVDRDAERDFMRPVRGRVGRGLYVPGEEVDEEEEEEDVDEEAEEEEEKEGEEDEEEEGEYLRMSKRRMRRGWGEGMGREE